MGERRLRTVQPFGRGDQAAAFVQSRESPYCPKIQHEFLSSSYEYI
jgi:hypothetical protein